MVCIATAMIMIIIRHCLLEFLVGSPLWANVQANIPLMKNIFLGVKGATMISLFAVVMTDIKSENYRCRHMDSLYRSSIIAIGICRKTGWQDIIQKG